VNTDDPWGWGRSLEWATSSPPPRFNFTKLPRIRSESPAFDLAHPVTAAIAPVNPVQEALDEAGTPEDER
jgi:cytochrome c oxidase subunit 1